MTDVLKQQSIAILIHALNLYQPYAFSNLFEWK